MRGGGLKVRLGFGSKGVGAAAAGSGGLEEAVAGEAGDGGADDAFGGAEAGHEGEEVGEG